MGLQEKKSAGFSITDSVSRFPCLDACCTAQTWAIMIMMTTTPEITIFLTCETCVMNPVYAEKV